jgi:protein-serine/threonine kinase
LVRFVVSPDGKTHEHHLKSARRQEKLSNMLREMVGAKKKGVDEEDPGLSLVSSWLRSNERDNAVGKKDSLTAPTSLVEKYGKCHEIIGKGIYSLYMRVMG